MSDGRGQLTRDAIKRLGAYGSGSECVVCGAVGSVLVGGMETVPCPVCNQAGYKGTAWSGDYDGKEWYVLQKRPKQGDRRYMGVRGSRVGEHREREAADEA